MRRQMNAIEKRFFDALEPYLLSVNLPLCSAPKSNYITAQAVIGIYQVDFLFNEKYVIEIDGHEFHKTKEQREYDYKRDRYLKLQGYTVIRFMGTEVFLDPVSCWGDVFKIWSSDSVRENKLIDEAHDFFRKLNDNPCLIV